MAFFHRCQTRDATELRHQRRQVEEETRSSQAIFKSNKSLTGSTLLKTIFIDPSYNLRSSCMEISHFYR
ncbi:hypothetical protein F2Q70_00032038 [Brassica cretica]|uniref:Uncharacterized protein n=1 Tax=Brassica cretica TaxID=69181 RepID=A0A8S9FME3_BRACR|nr:hypothetical protein F2Q70_00032038 [Brassica cretica]